MTTLFVYICKNSIKFLLIFYLISDIIKVERKGVGFMIFKDLLTSVTKEEMVEYFSLQDNFVHWSQQRETFVERVTEDLSA